MNVNKLVWKFINLKISLIQLKDLFQPEDMVLHLNNLILQVNLKKKEFMKLKNTKKINKNHQTIKLLLLLLDLVQLLVVQVEILHNLLQMLLTLLNLNFKPLNVQLLKKVKPLKSIVLEKLLNLKQLLMDNLYLTVTTHQEDYCKKMLEIKQLTVLDKHLALLKLVIV